MLQQRTCDAEDLRTSACKRWVYSPLKSNRIQVTPNKDKLFIIEKCL